MIVNFRITDAEIDSNELYETKLLKNKAEMLLKDAICLLNNAYEITLEDINDYNLSEETKAKLTEAKLYNISNIRDNGWSVDTAINIINEIYDTEIFKPIDSVFNYEYKE